MTIDRSAIGGQQPQPKRDADMQQQHAGGEDSQPPSHPQPPAQTGGLKPGQDLGDGSDEATSGYQKKIGEYLRDADVGAGVRAAKPASQDVARELKEAEDAGLSHSKGEH